MNKDLIWEKGFDTRRYLQAQIRRIENRVAQFDKLYLEFGGKLRYDHHASRVLPGFELDTKVQLLKKLGEEVEIVHCISAKDIEGRKIRRDFGLSYEDQVLKDISDLNELGLYSSGVVINRYSDEPSALKFMQKLKNRKIRVYLSYEIKNYLEDLDYVLSDKGYGRPEYVELNKKIVIVTAPGPGSGKMSFCMSQLYQDRNVGILSGYAKYETFPVWNLELDHPLNVAYEAATADIGDYNLIDPFHLEAYNVISVNYNRDVENFVIMKKIIEKMAEDDDPLATIRSPTDMGVNMTKEGIIDDEVVRKASEQEIVRRYYRYNREFVEGVTIYDTLGRMEKIMSKVNVKPSDRNVVLPANEAARQAMISQDETKGYEGLYCGAAIEILNNNGENEIITGKNSIYLHAESAVLLNAVKTIAGIPDEILIISPIILESLKSLKSTMNLPNTSLDVKEVLDALAVSAVFNPNATKCLQVLNLLEGCEMHTTHLMDTGDEKPLKELGLNITTDAKLPYVEYTK
jgi:uncharacterized protein (UPF0371 family)